jgi:hypothetical protein
MLPVRGLESEAFSHVGKVACAGYRSELTAGRRRGALGTDAGIDHRVGAIIFPYRAATNSGQSAAAVSALHQLVRSAIPAERPGVISGKALLVGARLSKRTRMF